ncbi:uncharacterized protein [Periplaneta americana]|uniref:uncharacterized protein n=1 Tax=Periplaneta americana TaxID=6978 RepID=UPI0037E8F893
MLLVKCLAFLLVVVAARAASIPLDDDSDMIYLGSPVILTQVREKRSAYPGRAMMFHGYFGSAGHPYHNAPPQQSYDRHNGRSYDPQGAMTAFAAGDAVSAGSSYYGGGGGGGYDCSNCNGAKKPAPANGNGNGHKNGNGNGNGHEHANGNGNGNGHANGNGNGNGFHQHEVPSDVPIVNEKPVNGNGAEQKPLEDGYPNVNGGNGAENEVPLENGGEEGYLGDQPAAEETPKGETLPPAAPTPAAAPETPKKAPAADEDDEEDDEPSLFNQGKGRGRGPYYNSYFPMVFGGYPGHGGGRGGNREEGGAYNPGVATAIANSFSTGRGAVATSHATAYGGPQFLPSGYRKNGSRTRPH